MANQSGNMRSLSEFTINRAYYSQTLPNYGKTLLPFQFETPEPQLSLHFYQN